MSHEDQLLLIAENKVLIILKALMLGLQVTIGGRVYCFDVTYRLCVPGMNETTNEPVLLVVDMGEGIYLKHFVDLCGRATEGEIVAIAANIALNSLKG